MGTGVTVKLPGGAAICGVISVVAFPTFATLKLEGEPVSKVVVDCANVAALAALAPLEALELLFKLLDKLALLALLAALEVLLAALFKARVEAFLVFFLLSTVFSRGWVASLSSAGFSA